MRNALKFGFTRISINGTISPAEPEVTLCARNESVRFVLWNVQFLVLKLHENWSILGILPGGQSLHISLSDRIGTK